MTQLALQIHLALSLWGYMELARTVNGLPGFLIGPEPEGDNGGKSLKCQMGRSILLAILLAIHKLAGFRELDRRRIWKTHMAKSGRRKPTIHTALRSRISDIPLAEVGGRSSDGRVRR